MFEMALTTIDRPYYVTLVYNESVWGARRKIHTSSVSGDLESIAPDTEVPMSFMQMAESWEKLGTPAVRPETELSVDPDHYPLF